LTDRARSPIPLSRSWATRTRTLAGSPSPCAEADRIADEIAELSAHLDAATHRLLTLVREFDAGSGWYTQGALSCAAWLSWRIGLDLCAAREKVRVARALGSLPRIDEAFRRGQSHRPVFEVGRCGSRAAKGADVGGRSRRTSGRPRAREPCCSP
jgi:hypothetical protein